VHRASDDTVRKGDRPCQFKTQIFRSPGNESIDIKLDTGDYVGDTYTKFGVPALTVGGAACALMFAGNIGFSAMAGRMAWPPIFVA